MATQTKYRFSFTGASAMIPEFIKVAQLVVEGAQVDELDDKTMGREKLETNRRQFRELKHRIKNLTLHQIEILATGNIEEQKQITHLALCKTYGIYKDFVTEVIAEKVQVFDYSLTDLDYNTFISSKKIDHPELEDSAPTTQKKVKQVIFRMLKQVGLLNSVSEAVIQTPMLHSGVEQAVISEDPNLLTYFLYDQNRIDELV
ncbi:DUF1819 family protein [Fodinibius salsisoli]|uniref:DUF1819 family protein n=1 Tax=Fodinibius salsisoli TaxID=2820877 RepID=A0ABT3PJ78_9BACT|nr:DUF1819 family protein [Fodinibius salsisoli]MCW9705234.1 DUF1819 family protein [Fodinibius salsisoli]